MYSDQERQARRLAYNSIVVSGLCAVGMVLTGPIGWSFFGTTAIASQTVALSQIAKAKKERERALLEEEAKRNS